MSKMHLQARAELSSSTARDAVRRKLAEQAQQEIDAEKQALEERTAQLRAKRLAQEPGKA